MSAITNLSIARMPTGTFRAGATAQAHWERLHQRINLRAAAVTFLLLSLLTIVGFSLFHLQAESFYYAISRDVNYCDMQELNEYGDYVLQNYLQGTAQENREGVVLGASYAACGYDPDPEDRLHNQLQSELERSAPGQRPWQVSNLASNGYDAWSLFYVTRLLNERRRPELLIVSLDILHHSERSLHLVLNTGVKRNELTPGELAPVVPLNSQLLYTTEANTKRILRASLPGFRAFTFLSTSYPKRENIKRWFIYTMGYTLGNSVVLTPPHNRLADGTHKNWLEQPETKRLMERRIETGTSIDRLSGQNASNLELLGQELASCQSAGTRVIVVTMPRNPVVPLDPQGVDSELAAWAERYQLEFHNFWQSGLIPTECFLDTGHYIGKGSQIMAEELARLAFPATTAAAGGAE